MKRTSRKPSSLSESVQRQLNAYALAASAAGVGMVALALPAEAKIVYTQTHTVIPGHTRHLPLDLNHDGIVDFSFANWSFSNGSKLWLSPPKGATSLNEVWGTGRRRGQSAFALRRGVQIGPSRRFRSDIYDSMAGIFNFGGTGTERYYGLWKDVDGRYLGLKFAINGKMHYGWARLNVHFAGSFPLIRAVLTGYAYETIPNKPIITGKIKGPDVITLQPGSLGALAAGASGRNSPK